MCAGTESPLNEGHMHGLISLSFSCSLTANHLPKIQKKLQQQDQVLNMRVRLCVGVLYIFVHAGLVSYNIPPDRLPITTALWFASLLSRGRT